MINQRREDLSTSETRNSRESGTRTAALRQATAFPRNINSSRQRDDLSPDPRPAPTSVRKSFPGVSVSVPLPIFLEQTADTSPIRFTRACARLARNSPSTGYTSTQPRLTHVCLIHLATYQPTDLASSSPLLDIPEMTSRSL